MAEASRGTGQRGERDLGAGLLQEFPAFYPSILFQILSIRG
jgi:hypothetical protein